MAINLNKITLEKQGDSYKIDLSKGNKSDKEIVVNLNWTQDIKGKGILSSIFGKKEEIDLDLGCFYELKDGKKMVIDGVQFSKGRGGSKEKLTRQGRYTDLPWIWHTGDDRSGAGEGENILVNPKGIRDIKRIIVYCFIYDGVVKWAETNAVVTVKVPDNPDIIVEMGKQYNSKKFCAIAEIVINSNESFTVKKLVSFHNGHGDCDKVYGWGFNWTSGGK